MAAGEGMSLPMIGALLGHRDTSTTNRYAHLAEDRLKHANDEIGDHIQVTMYGKSKAPLLAFRKTRRKKRS